MTRRRHPAGQAGIIAAATEMAPLQDDGFYEEEAEDDEEQPTTSVQLPSPPPKLVSDVSEPTNSDGVRGFDWNFGDFLEFDIQFERINIGLDEDDESATEVENDEDGINVSANILLTSLKDASEERGQPHFSLHTEELQPAPEKRAKYMAQGRISPTGGYVNPFGDDTPSPYALAQLDEAMTKLEASRGNDAASQVFYYPMNRLLSIEMAKIVRGRGFNVKRWKRTNGLVGFNYFLVLYKKK